MQYFYGLREIGRDSFSAQRVTNECNKLWRRPCAGFARHRRRDRAREERRHGRAGRANELATFDKRQSKIVELRFFGGLSLEETAETMKISTRMVQRKWSLARAWLYRELSRGV